MEPNLNNTAAKKRNNTSSGFSLIELLVVIAVILIVAAIAIPNFMQSRERGNESSAVQNLRTITTANVIYSTTYEQGYSASLGNLGGTGGTPNPTGAQLIDSVLATGTKSGYLFSYVVVTTDSSGYVVTYTINADPSVQNITGMRHFYTDQTGVIRENDSSPATSADNPI